MTATKYGFRYMKHTPLVEAHLKIKIDAIDGQNSFYPEELPHISRFDMEPRLNGRQPKRV